MARAGFPELIVRRREELKLSQAELAARLSLSSDFIGLVERTRRKPALNRLPAWARALEVPLGELSLAWIADDCPAVADVLVGRRGERYPYRPGPEEVQVMAALGGLDDDVRQAVALIVERLAR
jgi:transcriptional regulator with XRE-family HTH domain